MQQIKKIAPPNSLLFIAGRADTPAPEWIQGRYIVASDKCISVGCLAFMDGETEVQLGSALDVRQSEKPAFDGYLPTPERSIVVSTVEREIVLSARVSDRETRIRVWTNHPTEPDKVVIGWG
jgi:hypothetical protein